jgi:Domain of unknown function (DUF397)
MRDLYGIDLSAAAWRTPCGGNVGDQGDGCVELTRIPGGGVAVRGTTQQDTPPLRFSLGEWSSFIARL